MLGHMFIRELALRPNCLLTRRPIQILTRPKNILGRLIRPLNSWIQLRYFLYQHGYQVELIHHITQVQNDRHIICDEATYMNLMDQLDTNNTLTVVSTQPLNVDNKTTYQVYTQAHRNREFYSKMLDHCIVLAEYDYLKG